MATTPPHHPFAELVGYTVDIVASGRAHATLDVGPEHHNPNGVVHGAVLFALVDTSMGGATMSALDDGCFCASIEVHLRFLRPVTGTRLVAETQVVRAGRRVVQLESRVFDGTGDGTPVATATGSFAVLGPSTTT